MGLRLSLPAAGLRLSRRAQKRLAVSGGCGWGGAGGALSAPSSLRSRARPITGGRSRMGERAGQRAGPTGPPGHWKRLAVKGGRARTLSLAMSAPEEDKFMELPVERANRVALDCARSVLGTTGGRLSRIIPHHSKEAARLNLKARLALLRVVRREIHARKEYTSASVSILADAFIVMKSLSPAGPALWPGRPVRGP
jgi:hypothetical protein